MSGFTRRPYTAEDFRWALSLVLVLVVVSCVRDCRQDRRLDRLEHPEIPR